MSGSVDAASSVRIGSCGGNPCGWLTCGMGANSSSSPSTNSSSSCGAGPRACRSCRQFSFRHAAGCQSASRRRQAARSGQERQYPAPGRHRDRAEYAYRQALLHHHRYHRRLVPDHSAEWALCDPHAVCGLCAGIAGSAAERRQPRPDGELRVDAGFAGGEQEQQQAGRMRRRVRRLQASGNWRGTGRENLSLMSALSADTETAAARPASSGAELPSVAGNSDFGEDSVAISGQSGQVSPLAGVDMDRMRDAIETIRAPEQAWPGGLLVAEAAAVWRWRRIWRRWFGGGGFGGGGFGGGGSAAAGAATSAASIPASRTGPSSGWAATRR